MPSTVAPPPQRSPLLKPVVLGSIFVLAVFVMRAPSVDRIFHTLPANTGDPALVAWIMSWDVHTLVTHPLHLFNAPIFWPRSLTLAYSDLMLPAAPVYGVLLALTGSSVAALNLLVLLMMVGTQVSTYLLTKRLTGRDDAAVLAVLAFTFSGYALGHWGHPQLQTLGLLPLGFLLLFRVLDVPSTGRAVAFGIVTAASGVGRSTTGFFSPWCAPPRPSRAMSCRSGIASSPVCGADSPSPRESAGVIASPFGDPVTLRLQSPARLRSAFGARVGIESRRPVHSGAAQLPVRLDGAHRHRNAMASTCTSSGFVCDGASRLIGLVVVLRRRGGQHLA